MSVDGKIINSSFSKLFLTLSLLVFIKSTFYEKLKFNKNGEFIILQFTDLHYGENGMNDILSTVLQEDIISFVKPDAVIITGDSVSGYAWNGLNNTFYSDLWNLWTRPMKKLKIPYAYTLGNHDDQGDLHRRQIMDLDSSHEFSLSQYNPTTTGASNYFVPIYSSDSKNITTLLWLFDTNDETCLGMTDSWGCFEQDQVKWYEEESDRINNHFGYLPQGLAFFHIPIPEYLDMHNWRKTYGNRNEAISCPRRNTNLFKSMLVKENINATFCGHDHDNDNGGFFYGIELAYGRKSGYGGYGPSYFQRGARVIKLNEKIGEKNKTASFDYMHYVVQEDLSIVENSKPVWKGTDRLTRCGK